MDATVAISPSPAKRLDLFERYLSLWVFGLHGRRHPRWQERPGNDRPIEPLGIFERLSGKCANRDSHLVEIDLRDCYWLRRIFILASELNNGLIPSKRQIQFDVLSTLCAAWPLRSTFVIPVL